MNAIQTTHNLDFEAAPWEPIIPLPWAREYIKYRIGTCEGAYCVTKDTFEILVVTNNDPGNGHFNDVLEWFEYACKRDGKDLLILEVWNQRLRKHLLTKRGFKAYRMDDVIKKVKSMK